jgi:catechol 2,3-dioxygenase-like lactoylglutathione lyase family enzyme
MPVTQLLRVGITVADLERTASFYRDALGLTVGPARRFSDPAWNRLLGLDAAVQASGADVIIGRQVVRLIAYDPPGAPYPPERASNDQWFEHVALVTGDIASVWKRLEQAAAGEITEGAPVLLPPNTGAVTAFKFRDPEGHPLELIFFPEGVGSPVWHESGGAGIRGYDHTAISVMDVDRSLAFYEELLGFRIAGRSLNTGPEQDKLDGLMGCAIDVVALQPTQIPTPHVELLHYRTPPGRTAPAPVAANDVASARQFHKVDDLPGLVRALEAADVPCVSPGIVALEAGGQAAAVRDPDGHMVVLMA